MADECQHGSLARSCEICQRDKEIDELRAKLARYKGALRTIAFAKWCERLSEFNKVTCPTCLAIIALDDKPLAGGGKG